jgi:hypothetical protein
LWGDRKSELEGERSYKWDRFPQEYS